MHPDKPIQTSPELLSMLHQKTNGNLDQLISAVGPEAAAQALRKHVLTETERAFPRPQGVDADKWAEMVREEQAMRGMPGSPAKGEKFLELADQMTGKNNTHVESLALRPAWGIRR